MQDQRCIRLSRTLISALISLALVLFAPSAFAADPAPPLISPAEVQRSTAPIPSAQGVKKAIGPLTKTNAWGSFSGMVIDPGSGEVLFDRKGERPLIPASTAKLATAAAALKTFGTTHRLTTTTKRFQDTIYLVGGGDTTLTRPQLRKLARETVKALGATKRVNVVFDESLFSGPKLGPSWSKSFPNLGVAAPVSALMVGLGKTAPGARSRVKNPARQAATLFVQGLKAQGVQVESVVKGVAPATATELAQHQSVHMTGLIGDLLADSDNDLAESLAHLVGGKVVGDASFEGGAQATASILKSAGISTAGMKLADGSGLSRSNAISADTLADLLSVVALGKESSWWPISAGLAIAGSTGTLANRFKTKSTKAGAGVVRAKTGSLTGVSSLAGLVRDDDGRLLVFALISNKVSSLYSARETMDKIASQLAECGCTS